MVKVCSHNGEVFAIEPPLFVELEVIETEPGFAGNTAQGATKPATVETGAQVQVPLFVNQGDKLKMAKTLMQNNPDILTKDVAEMVGFSDAFYFSRVFKSHEGMSPSQFLKNLRKD